MLEEDLSPACSVCGKPASTIKLLHEDGAVRLLFEGICGGNGAGDIISDARADKLRAAFTPPHTAERVSIAELHDDGGFCRECSKFYCYTHWHVSTTGGGWCPKDHFKSLDPHWTPDDW